MILNETIVTLALIAYSVLAIFLSLKVGKVEEKEKEKQSLAFRVIIFYGNIIIISFPIFCIFYYVILCIKGN